ncbi:MAG: hypothetical protein PHF97_00885, partial [Bacteroidales bacterium]|nr:hypothetical protein [Bacteroidales bacterium]
IENGRWLVKTDYLGDTLWTRTFREIGSNYISEHSLIQATDGGTIASPGLYFYQVSCHGIAFGSGKIVRSAK